MSQLKVNSIVDAAGGSNAVLFGVASPPNSMGFRNRIINGDCRIDQRNNGASVTPTTAAPYTVDRFYCNISQASKLTAQQNAGAVTPPAGFRNYLGVTSSSAYSVLAADYFGIIQSVEGFNTADLMWGTVSAQAVTLSFWVRSSLTGTFGGAVFNGGLNRSYAFSFAISAANTWEQKTITIPGDTSGTWLTNNGAGISVNFNLGTGSTYTGSAGSWAGSLLLAPTGAVSVVGTNGATFYITGVQLEAGSVATPFERRDYGRELIMCQRYFETGGTPTLFSGNTASGFIYYLTVRYAVTKRAAASVATTEVFSLGFPASAPSIPLSEVDTFIAQKTANSTTNGGYYQFRWTASAEL